MIAVTFALEYESAAFRARHDPRLRVTTWILGAMGTYAAMNFEKRLDHGSPRLVISAGFAGGLQPEVAVGDLVVGVNYSDPGLVSKIDFPASWRKGDVITEPAIIEKAADKTRLGQKTGALAGDLETALIANICASRGIPVLSIRCISDALQDDMPVPADILFNPKDGRPDSMRLFKHVVKNPMAATGFGKLMKHAKIAQTNLGNALEEVILPQLLKLV